MNRKQTKGHKKNLLSFKRLSYAQCKSFSHLFEHTWTDLLQNDNKNNFCCHFLCNFLPFCHTFLLSSPLLHTLPGGWRMHKANFLWQNCLFAGCNTAPAERIIMRAIGIHYWLPVCFGYRMWRYLHFSGYESCQLRQEKEEYEDTAQDGYWGGKKKKRYFNFGQINHTLHQLVMKWGKPNEPNQPSIFRTSDLSYWH